MKKLKKVMPHIIPSYSFLKADLLIYKVDILFKYQKQNFKCITSTLLYISLNGANGVR